MGIVFAKSDALPSDALPSDALQKSWSMMPDST